MPYIDDDAKDELRDGYPPGNAGELTYAIQQLLMKYLEETGLRYQQIAEILGSLDGAKLDFIERVVKPYEAKKRSDNGDVWPLTLTGLTGNDDDHLGSRICKERLESRGVTFTETENPNG